MYYEMGQLSAFGAQLRMEERSEGTIAKYLRDVQRFARWLGGAPVEKQAVVDWRRALVEEGYAAETVNSMTVAVNRFLAFIGCADCRVRTLRVQRRLFRSQERELSRTEYLRLVRTAAARGNRRLSLLMEAIAATGIRVSEVQYLTVQAARTGRTEVRLKGKVRIILLPHKLCRKLLNYAKTQKIASGEIFRTRSNHSLSRKQIWAEMKALCKLAGVAASKVFPHNLRHLFARVFYQNYRDVTRLADILGHSSIETTRIYLISTGEEHASRMEGLKLVL